MLAQRSIQQQGDTDRQFLIHWRNKPVEKATWEEKLILKSKFPTFSLEDKTALPYGMFILEEKKGHVEERKRIQLEEGITVSGGTKREC